MNIWEAIQAAKAGQKVECQKCLARWDEVSHALRWERNEYMVNIQEWVLDGWELVEPQPVCDYCGQPLGAPNDPPHGTCYRCMVEQNEALRKAHSSTPIPTLTIGGETFEVWAIKPTRRGIRSVDTGRKEGPQPLCHFEMNPHFGGGYVFGDLGRNLTDADVHWTWYGWRTASGRFLESFPKPSNTLEFATGVLARRRG